MLFHTYIRNLLSKHRHASHDSHVINLNLLCLVSRIERREVTINDSYSTTCTRLNKIIVDLWERLSMSHDFV